jgi:hypothetical protein
MLGHQRLEPVDASNLKAFINASYLDATGVAQEMWSEVTLSFTDTQAQIQDKIDTAIIATAAALGITVVPSDILQFDHRRLGQLEFLGSTFLAADAVTTAALAIPARDYIVIVIQTTGFDITDIAALQFNSDTGANYVSRYLSVATGGVTWVNTATINATRAKLFHVTTLSPKVHFISMINRGTTSKSGWQNVYIASGNVGATPAIVVGGFEWVNTAAQITSVVLFTDGGNKLLAGSGFAVWGGNF